jgi:hypothetical protein
MVIPNMVSISEPAIANTVSNAAAVIMAIFDTACQTSGDILSNESRKSLDSVPKKFLSKTT